MGIKLPLEYQQAWATSLVLPLAAYSFDLLKLLFDNILNLSILD